MLFTLQEIFDAIIMTLAVGFIFKDFFDDYVPKKNYDPLKSRPLQLEGLWLSVALTAPAIVLHELCHKLVALAFGLTATFHAAYTWLAIGIVLKLVNFPFLFFVPGYVAILGPASPLIHSLIAFAGPGLNLFLWLVPFAIYKFVKIKKRRHLALIMLTSRINMFLFIFNMLPIPGFDGWTVYSGIFQTFFR
ncbi:MAG: hypothetical protein EPN86_01250 [Nanoarchaeota archaeon]|nr:MAG: hypothetical protein EPN86_01250 [Nanoarchaeota archaeon]